MLIKSETMIRRKKSSLSLYRPLLSTFCGPRRSCNKSVNSLVMQHFPFDDDRRRLLRPSVILDDISVLDMSPSSPGVYPFRFLCHETTLEFNNLAEKRDASLIVSHKNNSLFFYIVTYIHILCRYCILLRLITCRVN